MCQSRFVSRLALPHSQNPPAAFAQLASYTVVSFTVLANLSLPELRIGCGRSTTLASVSMPETPIYEDDTFPLGKDNIRATGQLFHVEPEPIAEAMQQFSN